MKLSKLCFQFQTLCVTFFYYYTCAWEGKNKWTLKVRSKRNHYTIAAGSAVKYFFSQIAVWQANLKNKVNKKQLKAREGARAFLRLKM